MQSFLIGVGVFLTLAPLIMMGATARLIAHGFEMGWEFGSTIVRASRKDRGGAA